MRGGETATGKVLLEGDSIKILGELPQQFARTELLSVTAGVPKERNYWTGRVSAGGNLRSGNTDEVEGSANVSFQRRTVENRISLDYLGNYSSTNDVESSNNHRANAVWDWFFRRNCSCGRYFSSTSGSVQNIDSRHTLGIGLGYQLIDTARTDWSICRSCLPTTLRRGGAGESRDEDTAASALAPASEIEITSQIDLDYDYVFQFSSPESGEYNHHMIGTFEPELTDALDFDLSLVWDRINKPRANADGTVPEQDDYRLIVGIGYDF
jgi:hypothetical protein